MGEWDMSLSRVGIRCVVNGKPAMFSRIPCHLAVCMTDHGPCVGLRDRVSGHMIGVSAGPVGLSLYRSFLTSCSQHAQADPSLFDADGDTYVVVNGCVLYESNDTVVVWVERPGSGFSVEARPRD